MNIKATLAVINDLRDEGIVDRYALGGAVAAAFYIEAAETRDIDIFVALSAPEGSLILTLEPIYAYLASRGFSAADEGVLIEGWPVQFLPPDSLLVEEAIEEAVVTAVGDIDVTVFSAEHLAAIALRVGRPKDRNRLIQFWESGVLDVNRFREIVERHELMEAWLKFRRNFLE